MKLRLEVEPCETLQDACQAAQEISDQTLMDVEFEFNSVDCVAVPGGCPITLHNAQQRASQSRFRVTSGDSD